MITVRKLKLTIVNENEAERKEQYEFIRNAQYAQYQGLNKCAGFLYSAYMQFGDVKSEEFKAAQKQITNSATFFDGIEFGKGVDSKSAITQKVKKDFSTSLKNGLAKGERNVVNYKRTFPLMTRGRDLKVRCEFGEYFIKWVNKTEFKVVFGRKDKDTKELQTTLDRIVSGEYKVMQSSLTFKDKQLILILTFDIPQQVEKEKTGTVVGVDLGIAVPAYVALNDNQYARKGIGSADEFIRVRTQMEAQRRREYQKLTFSRSGQGRQKKMKSLDRFKQRERNFVKTYNHTISSEVVKFAKKYNADTIHLEKLEKDGLENRILRNWSYYELQDMIRYKAEREGIDVTFVKAAYTSQTCSCCGNVDKENRQTQSEFHCTKCGHKSNADFNAARNIALSTEYVK